MKLDAEFLREWKKVWIEVIKDCLIPWLALLVGLLICNKT